jgi:hypothetical protein
MMAPEAAFGDCPPERVVIALGRPGGNDILPATGFK